MEFLHRRSIHREKDRQTEIEATPSLRNVYSIKHCLNVDGYFQSQTAGLSGFGQSYHVEDMFRSSSEPLEVPLLLLRAPLQSLAKEMSELIMQWISITKGRSCRFHRHEIQDQIENIRDEDVMLESELYLQLIKATRTTADLVRKNNAWDLFWRVAKPSSDAHQSLRVFVESYLDGVAFCPDVSPLIRALAFDAFDRMRLGNSNPSRDSRQSFAARNLPQKVFSHSIFFSDGYKREIIYDASTTVAEAIDQAAWSVGCQFCENYTLVADHSGSNELLDENAKLAEILASNRFSDDGSKLLFTQLIFGKADKGRWNPDCLQLAFCQCRNYYWSSTYSLSDVVVSRLCALQILAENDASVLSDQDALTHAVSRNIPSQYLSRADADVWMRSVSEHRTEVAGLSRPEAQMRFLDLTSDLPFVTDLFFVVTEIKAGPKSIRSLQACLVTANGHGIHFYCMQRRICALSVGLDQITACKYKEATLSVTTKQLLTGHRIQISCPQANVLHRMLESYKKAMEIDHGTGDNLQSAESKRLPFPLVMLNAHARLSTDSSPSGPTSDEQLMRTVEEYPEAIKDETEPEADLVEFSDSDSSVRRGDAEENRESFVEDLTGSGSGATSTQENVGESEKTGARRKSGVTECMLYPALSGFIQSFWKLEARNPLLEFWKNKGSKKDARDVTSPGLEALSILTPGFILARRYKVTAERVCEKQNIVCAVDKMNSEKFILKFYTSNAIFDNSRQFHEQFIESKRVCLLVDAIDDDERFPPCLVFQRGIDTLDEFIKKVQPSYLQKKSILLEILLALDEIHSLGYAHCDLKPGNIMIFPDHRWKLMDFDSAVKSGEQSEIRSTIFYAAPEIVRPGLEGRSMFAVESSVDLWSFGIIVYEVLTDNRFYGPESTIETVIECMCGRKPFPGIACAGERQAQSLIRRLLHSDPRDRPQALDASQNAFFQTADNSSQVASKFGQVTNALNMLLKLTQLTLNEATAVSLVVSISIEHLTKSKDAPKPWHESEAQEVFTMSDDYLEDQPVFILKLGHLHRIRMSVVHERTQDIPMDSIASVGVINDAQQVVYLETRSIESDYGKREAVAFLDTPDLELQKLLQVSEAFGTVEEKYVPLKLIIGLKLAGSGDNNLQELKHTVYCKMVAAGSKLRVVKFVRSFREGWEKAPQWMRDAAKASVCFANIGVALM